ncbi:MAG: adenylyltransferase/cytidyltransferase family protein [Bacteroidales bacterium]|nr:adenylyltransferase/cytidyltransferase family protein [Bacteroidales bacterium]
MRVFYDTREAMEKVGSTVVTTGSFDGVHIGHKVIIERLKQIAEEIDGESTLVTFHPHPRKVLYPEQTDLKLINSQEEKINLLSKTGLDNLVIIPFSKEFAQTTSHDFITNILIEQLKARVIIVGQNHHFGHNRSGDFSYLYKLSQELGFRVEDIPLQDIENETVSSTKIRKALLDGNIMRANAYLDHQYIIRGRFSNSPGLNGIKDQKFFRIAIPEEEKLIPPPGVYATNTVCSDEFLKSMTVIHENEDGERVVDTTLMYDNVLLDGVKVTIYFYKKIRGQEAFSEGKIDIRELREAMEDVDELLY